MKKINKERIYIGDGIETTTDFVPKDGSDFPVYLHGKKLLGFVVSRRGDYYGIRFGKGHTWTNHIDGLLKDPVGKLLLKEDFIVLDI